jgi:hypothetical protein
MAENKTRPTDASVEDYILSKSQRAAAHRLPRVDGAAREGHSRAAKDVGAEHGRLRLVPLHLREPTHRGGARDGLCDPWPPTGGLRGYRRRPTEVLIVQSWLSIGSHVKPHKFVGATTSLSPLKNVREFEVAYACVCACPR